jgi:phosphoglycerate kinase
MNNLRRLQDANVSGKIVFLRCDLNVPFDDNGILLDDTRITSIIPTISHLIQHGAKIILASHFGRPKGSFDSTLSLKKLVPYLEEYYLAPVKFIDDMFLESNKKLIKEANAGEIFLLENLRFYNGEESNDREFAEKLATLADIYVNDAFSCCHRKHASIDAITKFLPSYPGLLMQNELMNLSGALEDGKKPQTLIIGGKKISTKLSVLKNLAEKMDKIIICGAMANNFLKALGHEIGTSFYEPDFVEEAKTLYDKYQNKIILPIDFVGRSAANKSFIKNLSKISPDDCILDIGINACEKICEILKNSKAVIWNGPIGFYEEPQYAISSLYIARVIAYLTQTKGLISIIGGGDAAAVAQMSGLKSNFSYISTGGGAFLKLLESGDLIGLKNLREKKS